MLSIKQKFILSSVLILISMIGILALGQFTTKKLKTFDSVSLEISKVEAAMLMLRRNEKDFLARKDLKYQGKFEKNFNSLINKVDKLNSAVHDAGLDSSTVEAMQKSFNQYNDSFSKIITIQKKIGLHSKDGLYGALRKSVHSAEAIVKEMQDYKLRADMLQLRRNEKDFMLRSDLKYLKKFKGNMEVIFQSISSSSHDESSKEELKGKMMSYQNNFFELVKISQVKGLNSKMGLLGAMRSNVHDSEQTLNQLSLDLNRIIDEELGGLDQFILTTNIIGTVLALIVMSGLAWLAKSILKPMKSLALTMTQVSEENDLSLRVQVESSDEIGETGKAFNVMLGRFQSIITEINDSANNITERSTELSNITLETHNGTQEQQGQISQVANAINDMSNSVSEVAQSASGASEAAADTTEQSNKGAVIFNEAKQTINTLSEGIQQAGKAINKVENDSDQIGSVLAVIRGIAEQTNLLALNAAIEAARAGEQGRGFAVVADEVRTLASRTQDATQEIQQMIEALQNGSKEAVQLMNTSRDQALLGVDKTVMAGNAITNIVTSVDHIDRMNAQIAAASKEQSSVAEEINNNIDVINKISSQATVRANQTADVSESLATLATDLHKLIDQFKV